MPHAPTTYNLGDGSWTLLKDFTEGDAADQPRLVRVTNTGAAAVELLVSPLHIAPGATPGLEPGVDLAAGEEIELGAVRPGGGNVLKVWGKGNGAAGKVSAVL